MSWVAMMFAAGLGLGLMFYGVAEPISHFSAPPHGLAEPQTPEAAQVALQTTYFHWGFNGWAIYAIMGLALAYFTFRRGGKNLVSATFVPLLGENASERPVGRLIDGLAIFATLFGTATSLGLGALQINSGMNFLWDVPISNAIGVLIIVTITALFVLSAVSGVERGIQFLSNLSGGATIALMVFFLLAGPTVFIIGTSIETIGGYILNVFPMSLRHGHVHRLRTGWRRGRSSTGRGGSPGRRSSARSSPASRGAGRSASSSSASWRRRPAWASSGSRSSGRPRIDMQISGATDLIATTATPELSLFTALEELPFTTITSVLSMILIAFFFISGADAAAIVMGMLASRGVLHPARTVTAVMGCLMGAIASALLLVGGLSALQQGAVLASVPFTFVIVGRSSGA